MSARQRIALSPRIDRRHARVAAVLMAVAVAGGCSQQPDFDLVVRGGTVIDGTGSPARSLDIGIKGDRVAAVGDLSNRTSLQSINAAGRTVSPGFIDVLGRSGIDLLTDGFAESHLRQGITTEILGEGSPAFWTRATADGTALEHRGLALDWAGLKGFFDKLDSHGTAINVGTLVPLSSARLSSTGAQGFTDAAMADGAFGVLDDVGGGAAVNAPSIGRHNAVLTAPIDTPLATDDALLFATGGDAHRIVISGVEREPTMEALTDLIRRLQRARDRQVLVWTVVTLYPRPDVSEAMIVAALKTGSLVATDAAATTASSSATTSSPAAFGTFARLLGQLSRDEHAIDLGEAIRRSTSVPAAAFDIAQRGIIRERYFADLVIFDPRAIADRATADRPNQYPAGIDYVIVNGVIAVAPKGLTGARPGYRLVHGAPVR